MQCGKPGRAHTAGAFGAGQEEVRVRYGLNIPAAGEGGETLVCAPGSGMHVAEWRARDNGLRRRLANMGALRIACDRASIFIDDHRGGAFLASWRPAPLAWSWPGVATSGGERRQQAHRIRS